MEGGTAVSNHEKMLERVRALLAKAAGGTTEEEAELLRAKADELMTKYAIELWQIEQLQAKTEERTKPEVKAMNIDWWWNIDQDLGNALWDVMTSVTQHARCRIAWKHASYNTKTVPVVGLPADLAYADMLFTHLFMQMVETMDPRPRVGEGTVEAIVRMKEAGLKWEEIYYRLRKAGHYPADQPWNASKMNYAGKYTRYCDQHGRERVRVTPSVYRRSFALGFSRTLRERLRTQREEQGQDTGSMALALRDIRLVVQEAVYEFFPDMRPHEASCQCKKCKESRKPVRGRDVSISLSAVARGNAAGKEATIISNSGKVGGADRREIGS